MAGDECSKTSTDVELIDIHFFCIFCSVDWLHQNARGAAPRENRWWHFIKQWANPFHQKSSRIVCPEIRPIMVQIPMLADGTGRADVGW
jgi:hypothetical protein